MTRAVILAAGQGSRLRPLTDNRPKGLVSLAGRSLLERQLDVLKFCGVRETHIVTGYRSEMIDEMGIPTTKNNDFRNTNMVESLFCARSFLQTDDNVIISYGDIVYEPGNLRALLSSTAEVALMIDKNWRDLWELRQEDPLEDAETLVLDSKNNVLELGNKPLNYERIHGQYTGLIMIRGDKVGDMVEFYDALKQRSQSQLPTFRNMYMTQFLQSLIDAGWETKAVLVHGGWLEVDSVQDLRTYESLETQGELSRFCKLAST